MSEKNILLDALDTRWLKLRKESGRIRRKFSEDAVHDLRVAARRLIAVLETVREIQDASTVRECRKRVKKLLDSLSPLRDLHVQRLHIAAMTGSFPQLNKFEKNLADKEDQTAAKVQKLLKQVPKIEQATTDARRHVRKPADKEAIRRVIDKRFRKVLDLADRIDASNTSTIHKMRLAFKKFRYTCEVAYPIIEKDLGDDRLEQFHNFQTMMGDIQDIEVLSARLSKWTEKRNLEEEMRPVLLELETERKKRIDTFMASAAQVRGFWAPGLAK
jgi:CHAD domain-containing protein